MAGITRRRFFQLGSLAVGAVASSGLWRGRAQDAETPGAASLAEFGYGDVFMASDLHESQLMNTHAVLMALSEDSLLKPLRQMSGMPAPGEDLGGWYHYDPDYDYRKGFDAGFAPGCTFGQWVSALARAYAITGDEATREKVLRLNRLYAQTITRGLLREESLSGIHLRQAAAGAARFAHLRERPAGAGDSGADNEHRSAAPAGTCGGT